jgi:hypothetical protein
LARLTLLASTVFDETRCCIAGIDSDGKWVRPGVEGERLGTKRGTRLVPATFLWNDSGYIGDSLALLEMDIDRAVRRTSPHLEDVGLLSRPRRLGGISDEKERIRFLTDHSENALLPQVSDEIELAEGLAAMGRSLILVGPVSLRQAVFGELPGFRGVVKYRARLTFKIPRQKTEVDLSCIDLKWRALGRALGASEDEVSLTGDDLAPRLSIRPDFYLAIGLTRGEPYAMVVGVHSTPDFDKLKIDGTAKPVKVRQNDL